MPAATPLPRGPTVLTLYSAADLLTAPGCPVCRYAGEAGDRYLGWFALEGHAQPGMISTLCGSLGMCARHTRRLMGQPGAAIRLTAVFRYVMAAVPEKIASRPAPIATCPACLHDNAAAGRALETLVEGLADDVVAMSRCAGLGGLCIPHLQAASALRPFRVAAALGDTLQENLADRVARLHWLAGTDHDAESRAALRQFVPAARTEIPGTCTACLASAQAERDALARIGGDSDQGARAAETRPQPLCGPHLADAAAGSPSHLRQVLTLQSVCFGDGTSRRLAARRRPARRHQSPDCPVCQASGQAAQHTLADAVRALRTSPHATSSAGTLCIRHHLALRDADKAAASRRAPAVSAAAGQLTQELTAAFEQSVRARRQGVPAPHSTAWRRAAAFLDGGVFGGCPPRER